MRAIPKSVALLLAFGAAALAGVTVGAITASPSPTPVPTIPVAAIPTSTPDLRPPPPTRTLTPTQRPTPTPEPRGRAVVFYASRQGIPVAVDEPKAAGGTSQSDHVFFRLAALRTTKAEGPPAYGNLFPTMKAAFAETTVLSPGLAAVGFIVGELYGDWGVPAEDVKLLLQQIVYTATEEPGIDRVFITQNGGKPAVINGITYDKALAREDVR